MFSVSADVSGEYPIKSFRQVAGAVTGDQIYITLFASESRTPDPFAYILDGGTMSMWAVKLGAQYTAAYPNIFPGGSFIMNGGTATINGLTSYQNQNYFRLNIAIFFIIPFCCYIRSYSYKIIITCEYRMV